MPEEVGRLGDLEEEAALQKHVAVLVGQSAEVVVLSGQFPLEFLERPAQHFSHLLSILLSFFCFFVSQTLFVVLVEEARGRGGI